MKEFSKSEIWDIEKQLESATNEDIVNWGIKYQIKHPDMFQFFILHEEWNENMIDMNPIVRVLYVIDTVFKTKLNTIISISEQEMLVFPDKWIEKYKNLGFKLGDKKITYQEIMPMMKQNQLAGFSLFKVIEMANAGFFTDDPEMNYLLYMYLSVIDIYSEMDEK